MNSFNLDQVAAYNASRIVNAGDYFLSEVLRYRSMRTLTSLPEPLRTEAIQTRCNLAIDSITKFRTDLAKVMTNGAVTPKLRNAALTLDVALCGHLGWFKAVLAEIALAVVYTPPIDRPADIESVDIHGCRHEAGAIVIDEHRPQYFATFLRDVRGVLHCAGDFGTPRMARDYAQALAKRYGWQVRDRAMSQQGFELALAA